ncbi:hypothetical protein A9Q95_03430 [Rhodobacterales bacterium 59_46_T64]|nr:hypothetical protein A9Q95_03430 [Rhodobacterales bacterium 59_46_T64]
MPVLTPVLHAVLNAFPQRLRRASRLANPLGDHAADASPLSPEQISAQLLLPARPKTAEETQRAAHEDRGRFLARQERWSDLSAAIAEADNSRARTSAGVPVADLLATGARGDVVCGINEALADGAAPSMLGLTALEEVLQDMPEDYAIALIVAHAHIDIGWAFRGSGWREEVTPFGRAAFCAHFQRAARILEPFEPLAANTPSLAAAHCALLAAKPRPQDHVADTYEALINLDPANPQPMRAMGNHLLPRWFGRRGQLELEARRTAARTGDIWGAGAYTWVYLDALAVDPEAASILDVEFFLDGVHDILERSTDQHVVNALAAFSAVTMAPLDRQVRLDDNARAARAEIHGALEWICTDFLRELHPLVWAGATAGPNLPHPLPSHEALRICGEETAKAWIAKVFEQELLDGTIIAFTPRGLRRLDKPA